jgi:hypothetical protein
MSNQYLLVSCQWIFVVCAVMIHTTGPADQQDAGSGSVLYPAAAVVLVNGRLNKEQLPMTQ